MFENVLKRNSADFRPEFACVSDYGLNSLKKGPFEFNIVCTTLSTLFTMVFPEFSEKRRNRCYLGVFLGVSTMFIVTLSYARAYTH